MTDIVLTRLTRVFAAQIDGVDITRTLDERRWAEIRAASRVCRLRKAARS
jgi:hypothetical protein